MKELSAIIFDVDGTLADTEEIHRLAFNATFDKFDIDWNWSRKTYARWLCISGGYERMLEYAESEGRSFKRPPEFEAFIRTVHQNKTAEYARRLIDGEVRLRPGVLRLLNEAREQELRLAIATSTALSNVTTLLDNNLPHDWQDWFEVIASCDVIGEKKPSPAVYRFVLDKLALPAESCIVIEDTRNGNRAALGAGLKTLITTHYFTRKDELSGASLVVDTLGEPGRPFHVSAGNAHGATYVDVPLLRNIVATDDNFASWESTTEVA